MPIRFAALVTYYISKRMGHFKHNFRIELQSGISFWLGCSLNAGRQMNSRVRLEFNPNKVAQHAAFEAVLQFLIKHTRLHRRTVKRFDLAVDIPAERSDVFLVKDNRAYYLRRYGHERTEYLGARSSDNRVKLYNKQVESKLGYPLTRLELTLNPEVPFENIRFPTVYCIQTMQTTLDEKIRVTDTERFIIGAILQGYGSVTDLGRKTRDKITRLLADYVKEVRITLQDYDAILHQLRGYIAGQAQTEATEKDQPPDVPRWVREADQREPGELPP